MGHWYDKNGNPKYTILSDKTGKDRDTTLADAKKLGLVPSVTTIISQLNKPFLEFWKKTELIDFIKNDRDLLDTNSKYILKRSDEYNSRFAKQGDEIHSLLNQYYSNYHKDIDSPIKGDIYKIEAVLDIVAKLMYSHTDEDPGHIYSEETFYNKKGFGGSIDFLAKFDDGSNLIIDFKTKSKDKLDYKLLQPDYIMQLAAYGNGDTKKTRYFNLLISTVDYSKIFLYEWDKESIKKAWKMFNHLLEFWKLNNL